MFTKTLSDNVAIITWNVADKSMNVLDFAGLELLEKLADEAIADEAIKGIVITSDKPDLAGGMDLNVIAGIKDVKEGNPAHKLFDFMMYLHSVLRKIERAGADPKTGRGGKPVAIATPGTALGIGLELMLACHKRFAADNPKAKIGLPEIKVGIFPGGGGTIRLIRMLGVMGAAPYLLEGKLLDPKKAKAAGLVDEVVEADSLLQTAKEWVLSASQDDIIKPWDKKGYKMPGGAPYTHAGFQTFLGGIAMTHGKTSGVYQAAKGMLSAVYEGALVPFDQALRIEAEWFTHVLMNPSAEAMIRTLFINKQALEKGAHRPQSIPDQSVQKLGVLGAGMMGAGIAHVALQAGIKVILIDRDQAACDKGRETITSLLDQGLKRKKLSQEKYDQALANLNATPEYAALSGCDLVIEAVFEDPGVKSEALQKAQAHMEAGAILATNTSTLPVSDLAKAAKTPENFIGIHFFSPVHKMLLVEVIKGKDTGDTALAKALDFIRQLKKTPIVVNDARFFYANRCIIPYVNEGLRMVGEGVKPILIENAAKQLGMPVGPLQLLDEISLELGLKISTATKAAMGAHYPEEDVHTILETLVGKYDRLGRKNGQGLYAYIDGKRVGLWPELAKLYPPSDTQPDFETIKNRLILIQVAEAQRAFDEGVLVDKREGDVGAVLGWGFAPWSGGPFSWMKIQGADRVKQLSDAYAKAFGERFRVLG